MNELSTLLDKINTSVDQRIKAVEDKDRETNEQREDYIKKIKKLSKRVNNMLILVNALCERKIPKSQYTYQLLHDLTDKLKAENCPITFTGDRKFSDPPYRYVSLYFKEGYTNCRVSVSVDEINYFYVWESGGMSSNELTKLKPQRLLEFIVEFERAENILKEFIISL